MLAASERQRRALRGLTLSAERQLAVLWSRVLSDDVGKTIDGLQDLLPAVGGEYRAAAAALAADYYDELREQRAARRRFLAEPVEAVSLERWRSLAAWGVKPLYGASPAAGVALTLIQGGLQRTVADGYRDTIAVNSVRDPSAVGWARVGDGSSCEFCAMLLDRGGVYTEASASFLSHDHCGCSAEPQFD